MLPNRKGLRGFTINTPVSADAFQMVLTLQNPFLSYHQPTEHILVNPLEHVQITEQSIMVSATPGMRTRRTSRDWRGAAF